jgi:glutamate/tyrosine decarboxylase-like PLP-dependent enzyme
MQLPQQHRQQLFANMVQSYLASLPAEKRLNLDGEGTNALAAWFLGPRGENAPVFTRLIQEAIEANVADRTGLYPDDPPYVTAARKDRCYDDAVVRMEGEYRKLLGQLKGSVPFFSYRYQAHMNWDLTMPSLLGYFAAMLYNQNNVALEASPVTSVLEKTVGEDLCKMLGFDTTAASGIMPWGHVTCDGSVANLEAMWGARNFKYYALSLKAALEEEGVLAPAKSIQITLGAGEKVTLIDQDVWTLLNLPVDPVLELPLRIQALCDIDAKAFSDALEPYLLQTVGFGAFLAKYAPGIAYPVVIGPATKHYSWPKNAALTGLGSAHFLNIPVDRDARMDSRALDVELAACRENRIPVLMVVNVLGSTEESAVDPLSDVLALRETCRQAGQDFIVHVDAAWGGYFASILREPVASAANRAMPVQETPVLEMSDYVTRQYQAIPGADSVTIDPHKAGYIPYAAGGLCYRNQAQRNLVAFQAPEVYHGESLDANMGIYGVEGSKPGAAAAGVYLSHRIIRPDKSGYGKILGQALFNSKRFYSAVVTMVGPEDDFVVVPVQQIPAERNGGTPAQIEAQLHQIKQTIVDRQNSDIMADPEAMELLRSLGSDQIIITYGLNFKRGGQLNTDIAKANEFMSDVFNELSMQPGVPAPDLIITTSSFGPAEYGRDFVATYMRRLGLDGTKLQTMKFLSSTTMSPWLTATERGDFIPTLIQAFRKGVATVLASGKYN